MKDTTRLESVTLLATMGTMPTPPEVNINLKSHEAFDVLAVWFALMPAHPRDGEGDSEDFWEMAYRLYAAVRSGADEVLLSINNHGGFQRVYQNNSVPSLGPVVMKIQEGLDRANEQPDLYRLYGPVSRYSPENLDADTQDALAARYGDSETFLRLAGRKIARCGYAESDEPEYEIGLDVRDFLRSLSAQGVKRAAVKSFRSKKMDLTTLDLPEGDDALISTIDDVLLSSMTMHLIGYPGALLAQEWVPMEYEYRVFIVNGKPVTGAGCIEEFTPLNADDDFSALMRRSRSEMSEVESKPELRDRYVEFARAAAAEFTTEGRVTYVLDLAVNADTGEPLVIELNGLRNSGLYASRPARVTEALVGD